MRSNGSSETRAFRRSRRHDDEPLRFQPSPDALRRLRSFATQHPLGVLVGVAIAGFFVGRWFASALDPGRHHLPGG